jgi:ABC-2 type transport system ATP-binding protein
MSTSAALDTLAETTRGSFPAWPNKPHPAEFAIRAQGLTRTFGTIRAVDNLTLEVPRGIVFGFLGPNGAGKTTTIRLLLGLLEPSGGHAEVLGFDTRFQSAEIRALSGALLEDSGIYDRLSAEANLDFYARVWHLSSTERHTRIRELLMRFDLWERRTESPELWSTGMRQKLAVARALLHRPALMFLDEPTSGLDPLAAHELGDDLARLASAEGVTVFLTTHDLLEAERLCQYVAIIQHGRLVATGAPAEIGARAAATATVVGNGFDVSVVELLRLQPEVAGADVSGERLRIQLREGARLAPLVTLLARAGVQIEEVRRSTATLEDAFVSLVTQDTSQ